MIYLKTEDEINSLRISNLIVAKVLGELSRLIAPGVTPLELDRIAHDFIKDHNAEPAFLSFNGFPNTLCVSVNDVVVHGIPTDKPLEDGDIVSIDCGVLKDGFYGDSAYTFGVGNISPELSNLLIATKNSLRQGIATAIEGKRLGDVGISIQSVIESSGFTVIRELVGHGVGRNLHEEPKVMNYGRFGSGIKLQSGMVLAIEPMASIGERHVSMSRDGWSIKTNDKKPTAHYEQTILVCKNSSEILSVFD